MEFAKEEVFLNKINDININLSNNIENENTQIFCLAKGQFINFKKYKIIEKYIILALNFSLI